jgi:integrase
MTVAKLTKSEVDRLAPGQAIWDTSLKGFGARRQKDGVFYYVRYRLNGTPYMKSLGRHGHLTPDEAKKEAKAKLGDAAKGHDPFASKARASETFGGEVDRYLAKCKAAMTARSFYETQRRLRKYAKPFHRLRLTEIDRRAIARRLGEIETASGAVTRNRVRSSLSAFFSWAIREGLLETNPVTGTSKAEERTRERVLTPAELRVVWRSLGQNQYSDIVRLLILTGQRRAEIGGLKWNEVNLPEGFITFPPERTKNKRTHELPLSPQAKAILNRQLRRNDRDCIFGNGKEGFIRWSYWKARLDSAINSKPKTKGSSSKPIPPWTIHDLRRTAATMMADLGTLPHVIEACLNHVSGHKAGVAGIYNRSKYLPEMRAALERWADYVEGLTANSTVTTFQRPRTVQRSGLL